MKFNILIVAAFLLTGCTFDFACDYTANEHNE
jgi:outer membrane biogenesis lipoprotein LolB